jgi:hypothetical protein
MKNLNFDFLLDIWADLKAKKLAPVAIGLVVAAIAIPALLMKGEETASEGPVPILASDVSKGPEVQVAQELADRGSKLDSYRARDPFKGKVKPDDDAAAGTGTANAPSTGGDPGGGSSGDTGSPLGGLGSGGSTGSSGSSGPSGDGGLGSTPTPSTPPELDLPKPKQRLYTFQLALNFGRPGREQRYPAVTRMTFLPRPTLPALLFMGVPEGERAAIFFVHPGMTHQGEGRCVPSPKNCNFLHLGIGQEHYLAANDYEFRIELLKVKRVPLSKEKQQRASARKASQRRLSRGVSDADTAAGAVAGEMDLPWLVDGISG